MVKNLDDDETNPANYPKADQDEHLMIKMTESKMILMVIRRLMVMIMVMKMTESRMMILRMMLRLMVMIMVLTPRMFSKPNVTGLFPSLSLQSWFVFPLRKKILQMILIMTRLGDS